jgi:SAM-dependent methyltransferase
MILRSGIVQQIELLNDTMFQRRYLLEKCPNDCSGNGLCENGQCICDLGFSGPNCSTSILIDNDEDRERIQVFDKIFDENFWNSPESVSGRGSELKQTVEVRKIVKSIVEKYNITSILDLPCGDLNWIQHIKFDDSVEYVGADIVRGLIHLNRRRFANTTKKFLVMDMVSQVPYKAFDLILCRDALVHLPDREVKKVLANFNKSGSKYFLTTTFPEHDPWNIDKPGQWRQINFFVTPYNWPPPLELYNEGYWGVIDHSKPYFNDKSLALWKFPVPLPNLPEDNEKQRVSLVPSSRPAKGNRKEDSKEKSVNSSETADDKQKQNAKEITDTKSQLRARIERQENTIKINEKHKSKSNLFELEKNSLQSPLRRQFSPPKQLKVS